jgi:acyl-CoA dehydrogenase
MNLALTEDQVMIRDAAQNFLADASGSTAVRAAMASAAGFDPALWQQIGGELGWCGTAIPERFGGLGLGPVELALILEQMGRHLACAPFFSTVCLAANVLTQAGSDAARKAYLPRIAAGALQATAELDASGVRAQKRGGAWRLSGVLPALADGASAEILLVALESGVFAIRREAPGVTTRALHTWDGTRRFAKVELRNAAAERIDAAGRKGGIAVARSLARLYLAAEQLGGAQQCLDLAVRHASERKQFGRAIASFQAVKHRCAEMMVKVEALRSAVYGAAAVAATKPSLKALAMECAMARALAAETCFHCAQEAIQLHGGVGFTWEYDPHLYFKRAQAGSHWLGTAGAMREQIAAALLG